MLLADRLPNDSLKAHLFPSLVAAAGNDKLDSLKALLDLRDRDTRERDRKDITFALVLAAFNGHEEIMKTLIHAGADVNATQSESIIFDYIVPAKPFKHLRSLEYYHNEWSRRIIGSDNRSDRHENNKHTHDGMIGDVNCYQGPEEPGSLQDKRVSALQAALAGLEQLHRNHYTAFGSQFPWSSASGTTADRENLIKVLLDHGADANALGSRTRLPITVASGCCSEQVVSCLIDAGADVHAVAIGTNTLSPTSLTQSWEGSIYEVLERTASVLLPDRSVATNTSAVLAIDQNELSAGSVLRRLLQAGSTLELDGESINNLLLGCLKFFYGDGYFVQTETLANAFIDGPGSAIQILLRESPLMRIGHLDFRCFLQSAIVLNERACVELLLERHVDVNATGSYYGTALQAAARFGHFEITQKLLEAGADPNLVNGCHGTALRAAVLGDHTATVELLLKHGADASVVFIQKLNSRGSRLPNPLLNLAVESGNASIISMLVSAGTDVVSDPPDHLHPLILACREGSLESVKFLLDGGAPVSVLGKELRYAHAAVDSKFSPIQMASYHGHKEVVRLLLSRNAGVNVDAAYSRTDLSSGGKTALSIAAERGHLDVVKELLDAHAVIYNPVHDQNALRSAYDSRSAMVLEYLLEASFDRENHLEAIKDVYQHAVESPNKAMLGLLREYSPPMIEVNQ